MALEFQVVNRVNHNLGLPGETARFDTMYLPIISLHILLVYTFTTSYSLLLTVDPERLPQPTTSRRETQALALVPERLKRKLITFKKRKCLGVLQLISIVQADQKVSRQLEAEPAAGHAGCDLEEIGSNALEQSTCSLFGHDNSHRIPD